MSANVPRWAPYAIPSDTSAPALAALLSSELLGALQDTCTLIQREATDDCSTIADHEFTTLLETRGRLVNEVHARLARAGVTRRLGRRARPAALGVAM